MSEDRRRRRPTGIEMESVINLSPKASERFLEVVEKKSTDSAGRTYVERMRAKADKAARRASH